jgi:glycosyltransferase involved in cell wall biosynthesis
MCIVVVSETLGTGGAETFVLRLATALTERGERVCIFVLRPDLIDPALTSMLPKEVRVEAARITGLRFLLKLDGILFDLGVPLSLMRRAQTRRLERFLRSVEANIIHSHLITSDIVSARAGRRVGVPVATTMHGDYRLIEHRGFNRSARIRRFREVLAELDRSLSAVICITDSQRANSDQYFPRLTSMGRIRKIYNGYAVPAALPSLPKIMREIPPSAFVIGMVSRGIREKGWEILIAAFQSLDLPDSRLVLVGDGDYIRHSRRIVRDERILFAGNVLDPLSYIARFDVACLPSQYSAESLPTVIIEYLCLGKPVIASDVGEIGNMLDARSDSPAGLLIQLGSTEQMIEGMKAALLRIYHAGAQRTIWATNAKNAALKFNMDECAGAYLSVYELARRDREGKRKVVGNFTLNARRGL